MTGEIDRLLADWRALEEPLRARLGTPPPGLSPLPNLVAVNLSVTNHPVAADAINAIDPLEHGWEGWLRRESRAGSHLDLGRGDGAPLDGEWVTADRARSARLVQAGTGWRLITMTEGAGGEPALREDVSVVAARPAAPKGMLIYAVYWALAPGPQDRPALTRRASRFLGFKEG